MSSNLRAEEKGRMRRRIKSWSMLNTPEPVEAIFTKEPYKYRQKEPTAIRDYRVALQSGNLDFRRGGRISMRT